jgi:hypothetical protein
MLQNHVTMRKSKSENAKKKGDQQKSNFIMKDIDYSMCETRQTIVEKNKGGNYCAKPYFYVIF